MPRLGYAISSSRCVIVEQAGKRVYDRTIAPGTTVEIVLP